MTMDELTNPTPTIEQLLAIEACREAARRYSYGVDRLDAPVMKSAYWPDAIDDHGVFVGIANHRVIIDADGENARGEAHNVVHLFTDHDRRLNTWYGRYLDTYQRRGTEWRILHRVCVHHGNTSEVLPDAMPIDAAAFRQGAFDRPAQQRLIGP
jgi:hypothetical protein